MYIRFIAIWNITKQLKGCLNMNYYEILQVSENASDEVIHMAYKALAKKYHPDLYQGDMQFAERKMKEINEAFDVLSNTYKRAQYDDYLKSQRKSNYSYRTNQTKQTSTNTTEKTSNEFLYPSSKKSAWIIGVLLFLSFVQCWHPYAESELYDYSFLLGTIDFCFVSIVMMIVPMFVGVIKSISPKGTNKLCLANSIIVYVIFLLLWVTNILSAMVIGWLNAIFYYFINKHILLQIKHYNCDRKKILISIVIILIFLVLLITGCTIIFNNNYATVKYDSYNVGVRTITVGDEFTAEYILLEWRNGDATEESMIEIMNKYGYSQGGGKLYVIEPGFWVEEVDNWCFDRNRRVGDVAIIKNSYGYTICYFAKFVPKD